MEKLFSMYFKTCNKDGEIKGWRRGGLELKSDFLKDVIHAWVYRNIFCKPVLIMSINPFQ